MSVDDSQGDSLIAFHVACDLLLDMALSAPRDLDPTDNLILLGVSQANVRQIVADPQLQLGYAFAATVPPDDVRRPISTAALSRALALPLETVRRRVARLSDGGLLVGTPQGLIVPAERLDTADHMRALAELEGILHRASSALVSAGFFRDGGLPAPRPGLSERPVRAIGRLAGDYYLRMLAPLRGCCGDPLDAIIVLALVRATSAQRVGCPKPPPGVGPGEIARAFAASPETVRRRLGRLVRSGVCLRVGRGYVVPSTVVDTVLLPRMAGAAELNLRRLFRQVADVSTESGCERVGVDGPRQGLVAAQSQCPLVASISGLSPRAHPHDVSVGPKGDTCSRGHDDRPRP